ncbi:MAG: TIGR03032 family protein [Planctomycetota bacterium]
MASPANDRPTNPPSRKKSKLRCRTSGNFAQWLTQSGGSLAITTYTSGLLVLVSSFEGRLRYRTQRFSRPMGLAIKENRLALAVRREVLLFQRTSDTNEVFRLRRIYHTGKVDAHDIAFGNQGVYFANTRYNAIARVSKKKHFIHCWQPSFIAGVVRGDRCHLNGIGMREGQPAMVTAFCATGHQSGWREQDRFTGGVMIDVERDEVVAAGLCMPHTPRWHNDHWWLCDSGRGLLSVFNETSGETQEVCALPGFTRGLSFVGNHALVGLSRIRRKHILDAPPVRQRVRKIKAGIALVDVSSGKHTGTLEFLDAGNEVFEVTFLPELLAPSIRSSRSG